MSPRVEGRRRGLALLLGGVALVLFVLSHPFGEVADAVTSPQWVLSHNLHFIGATLVALGLSAVHERLRDRAGTFGTVAYVFAFIGIVWFAGIGMISAYLPPLFPTLVTGTEFALHTVPFVATSLVMIAGFVLLAIAIIQAGAFPRWTAAALAVGAVLADLPPFLVPFVVLVVGGVLFGAALALIGYDLWRARAPERAAAAAGRA